MGSFHPGSPTRENRLNPIARCFKGGGRARTLAMQTARRWSNANDSSFLEFAPGRFVLGSYLVVTAIISPGVIDLGPPETPVTVLLWIWLVGLGGSTIRATPDPGQAGSGAARPRGSVLVDGGCTDFPTAVVGSAGHRPVPVTDGTPHAGGSPSVAGMRGRAKAAPGRDGGLAGVPRTRHRMGRTEPHHAYRDESGAIPPHRHVSRGSVPVSRTEIHASSCEISAITYRGIHSVRSTAAIISFPPSDSWERAVFFPVRVSISRVILLHLDKSAL